jgi:hypothetical protein
LRSRAVAVRGRGRGIRPRRMMNCRA